MTDEDDSPHRHADMEFSTIPAPFSLPPDDQDRPLLMRAYVVVYLMDAEAAWADGRVGFVQLVDWVVNYITTGDLPPEVKQKNLRVAEKPKPA